VLDNKQDAQRFAADIGKEVGAEDNEDAHDKLVLGAVRSGQKDLVLYVLPYYPQAGSIVEASTGNSTVRRVSIVSSLLSCSPCAVCLRVSSILRDQLLKHDVELVRHALA